MTVKHIVLAKFKPSLDAEARQNAFETSKGFLESISLVKSYTLGPPIETAVSHTHGWDFAMIADFEDLDAFNAYLEHELHLAMAKAIEPAAADMLSYQIDVSPCLSKS
ncbi:unnamed protein product [Somion occarium]|uniref:Stress-response A/B barrel domain-containing protein n=1 Tax=Somion occarium TaxID=3059160 RepID=A0ABP1CMC8_9APHY